MFNIIMLLVMYILVSSSIYCTSKSQPIEGSGKGCKFILTESFPVLSLKVILFRNSETNTLQSVSFYYVISTFSSSSFEQLLALVFSLICYDHKYSNTLFFRDVCIKYCIIWTVIVEIHKTFYCIRHFIRCKFMNSEE